MSDTKTIDTLIDDIYGLFGSGHKPSEEALENLGKAMAAHIARAFEKRENQGTLRGSNIGEKCDRKSWLEVNSKEEPEDVEPWAKIKFLYGHLLEELALFLAEEAAHNVSHRQTTITVDGIDGHTDGVIDGCIVDVKSANSRGMDKFRRNLLRQDDPFNYLAQVHFYRAGLIDQPEVTDKEHVYFLVIDKEMGHLVLDRYKADPVENTHALVKNKKRVVMEGAMPQRAYMPEPDGKSGNMQLPLPCRYCARKKECWPGLRTFLYSNGPRFLTTVIREPDVPEVK